MNGLPRPGDEFTVDGYVFHVQSMRERHVSLLRVTASENPDVPADAGGDAGAGTQAVQAEDNAPASEKSDVPAALGAQISSKEKI